MISATAAAINTKLKFNLAAIFQAQLFQRHFFVEQKST